MKSSLKKIVCLLICIMLFTPYFMSLSVKADDNPWRVKISRSMSREECWVEAGKHLDIGLSRERVAVEIFAYSQLKNGFFRYEAAGSAGIVLACGVGLLDHEAVTGGTSKFVCLAGVIDLLSGAGTVENFLIGDEIKLGDDSETAVSFFYNLWNRVGITPWATAVFSGTGLFERSDRVIYTRLSPFWRVVDISGNSNDNGAKVQIWSYNGTGAQKFNILWTGEGTGEGKLYNIFKAGTFKCLDVKDGKAEKGVNVQLWDYNGTSAQEWMIEDAGDGYVYLKNRLGFYLDVRGGINEDGTQIQTWTQNKTNAQKWMISS